MEPPPSSVGQLQELQTKALAGEHSLYNLEMVKPCSSSSLGVKQPFGNDAPTGRMEVSAISMNDILENTAWRWENLLAVGF